jgi:hypothetical protein
VPVNVGIAVENVGRLVNAIAAGMCGGIFWMTPSIERRGEWFAETKDAFKGFVRGDKGIEGELETFQADDGAAMAFNDGRRAIPVGAAKVATDD